jgi:mRNA interferase MazF
MPLSDLSSAGLPAASKVRFKLFTLDHRLVRGEIGKLSAADAAAVRQGLEQLLGASGPYHAVGPAV